MKDESLRKLLRVIGKIPREEAAMALGFDTRVLAHVREERNTPDYIGRLVRRTMVLASAIILLAGIGWYQTNPDDDYSSAYAMVNNVIDRTVSR